MTENTLRILHVEDSVIDAELCWHELERAGLSFVAKRVWSREAYEQALTDYAPDLILCDFHLPQGFDGLAALDILRASPIAVVPFILVSGIIGEDRAVEAMRRGATDYVLKDRLERLAPVVRRALQEAAERAALQQAQAALAESEERFRQLAENIQDVFFLFDAHDQRVLYVSPAYEVIWGESCASLYANGASWRDVVHPADRDSVPDPRAALSEAGGYGFEFRVVRRDGSVRWVRGRAFPILDDAGRLQRIAGIASDITVRKVAEERIARLNRIYAVLSGINTLIVRVKDRDELLRGACRIAIDPGRFCMAWIGLVDRDSRRINVVASAGDVGDFFATMPADVLDLEARGYERYGATLRSGKPAVSNDVRRDPHMREQAAALAERGISASAVVPLLFDGEGIGVFALYAEDVGTFDAEEMRLLTELAGDISFALDYLAKAEKLDYLAFYDALTGLPNRALFTERLHQQLSAAGQNGTKVALVLNDVKRFRLINESLGRQASDMLLREIAERARQNWPNPDSVSRIAADLFGGMLTDLKDEAGVVHALEKSFAKLTGEPYRIGEKELGISLSAGIAVFPADGADAETLFRNAEAALKKAKISGEDYLFYQPSMNAKVAETLALENKLRKAIDNDEFVLHYQPKVNLVTGKLSGLEALIRWNDPENGIVAPGTFMPLLEETGMILPVGAWAIRRALADHRRWRTQGLPSPRIAVNVSAIQLRQTDFVDTVRDAIGAANSAPHGLDLEITESVIMEDIEGSIAKLEALHRMNVDIAIDDFGTGYSSLSYLARLPVQLLKIDHSFIVSMTRDAESMAFVSTIIALGRSLKLKVVAEGVETDEQSHFLKLLECEEVQGFLFGAPLPFEQMTAVLNGTPARTH